TALAALFILGPVSVVVLAGPNNPTDGHGSVRTVLISTGRTGVVNHSSKPLAGEEKPPPAARASPPAAFVFPTDQRLCQSGRTDFCHWRGYPLWQWYSGA